MSVLEQQDLGLTELLKCKLNYLQSENTWMQKEYDFLCRLIQLQKQLIHSEGGELAAIQEEIAAVLAERREYIEEVKKRAAGEGEGREIEVEEFVPLIYSFEEKIGKLQKDIKEREASLQSLELARDDNVVEKKLEVKCISSYDSNSRLLDRIRREVTALKFKKARLENDLLALNEKKDDESTVGSAKVQSLSRVQQHTITQQDPSSAFERVVMLIKKKRFQNSCLEEKVARFRSSIAHKKSASAKLRREIEGMQWNCLDGFVGVCGFVESGENADLSVLGKSCNNNASFSFDVSRFIRPGARFRVPEN